MTAPVLEAAAQEIADATAKPPVLHEFGVDRARQVPDYMQAAPVVVSDVAETPVTVPAMSESASSNRSAPTPACR
ncbi:hypothetical protein [Streptomyces sp. NPDC054834]